MRNILLILFLASCSSNKIDLELVEKQKKYPYWRISIAGFEVLTPTEAFFPYYKRILIPDEKRIILRAFDTIKFVVNTQEFEEAVRSQEFLSSQDMKGQRGEVKIGDIYNNDRLLEVIRNLETTVVIKKMSMKYPSKAMAVVGEPLYVMSDNAPERKNQYWIALQNNVRWDQYYDYQDEGYIAHALFHEMLHNAGFDHSAPPVDLKKDAIYQLQNVFDKVYHDPLWQKKYRDLLLIFRPFYEKKYVYYLYRDTLDNPSLHNPSSQKSVTAYLMSKEGFCSQVETTD